MRRFSRIPDVVESLGGIANRPEILAAGFTPDDIRFAVQIGAVRPLCRGWYGSRELPRVVREAWRSGGPLACVSALEFEGLIEPRPGEPLHVCRRTRGHRLRHDSSAVIHWSDEALRSGSRLNVAAATAAQQAARCATASRRPEDFEELASYLEADRHGPRAPADSRPPAVLWSSSERVVQSREMRIISSRGTTLMRSRP